MDVHINIKPSLVKKEIYFIYNEKFEKLAKRKPPYGGLNFIYPLVRN